MPDLIEAVRMFLETHAKAWVYQHERGEEGRDHLQVRSPAVIFAKSPIRYRSSVICGAVAPGVRAVSEPADFPPSADCLECY